MAAACVFQVGSVIQSALREMELQPGFSLCLCQVVRVGWWNLPQHTWSSSGRSGPAGELRAELGPSCVPAAVFVLAAGVRT